MKDEKLALVANWFPPISSTWQGWSEAFDEASTNPQLSPESRDFAAGLLNLSNAFRVLVGIANALEKPKRKRRRRSTYSH